MIYLIAESFIAPTLYLFKHLKYQRTVNVARLALVILLLSYHAQILIFIIWEYWFLHEYQSRMSIRKEARKLIYS